MKTLMDIRNFQTKIAQHAYDRITERLESMSNNQDITEEEEIVLRTNLNNVLASEFPYDYSFGIMLGKFNINPESKLLTKRHKTGIYYEIYSLDEYDIMRDSTGNEIWGIIRNQKLITAFLRKTIQRNTAEKPRKEGGLGVDVVIDDFDAY